MDCFKLLDILVGISWYKLLNISRQIPGWPTSQLQSRSDIQAEDWRKWAITYCGGHCTRRGRSLYYSGYFWTAESSSIYNCKCHV